MIIGTSPRWKVINSSLVKIMVQNILICITLLNKTFTWNVHNTNGECSQEENNNARLNLLIFLGTFFLNKVQINGKIEMDKLTNIHKVAMKTHSS